MALDLMLVIAVAVFIGVGFIGSILSNKPKIADFIIETESELKKVSWPSRKEYLSASVAIVIMVIFMVFYLIFVDMGLSKIMDATSNLVGGKIGF
ncbi:MAG: preprotein translocase subunit SecE [Planctomycetes bacterium]|nr:preprotein translocase subunit SecE [Planctomycetota bacterium]